MWPLLFYPYLLCFHRAYITSYALWPRCAPLVLHQWYP
jgi:hypothetical protein